MTENKVVKHPIPEVNKVNIQLKEYDEVFCSKPSCKKVLKVDDNLTMVDGRRGYLTCPDCGHRTRVVKTRPADEHYNRDENGTRTRKSPKSHMSKKARRRLNKNLLVKKLKGTLYEN